MLILLTYTEATCNLFNFCLMSVTGYDWLYVFTCFNFGGGDGKCRTLYRMAFRLVTQVNADARSVYGS